MEKSVNYSVVYFHTNIFKNEINNQFNITSDLKNIKNANIDNGRFEIWKNSLPILKKHWAIGVGIDNFGEVYGVRNNVYYDKAHNVYLQIAVTNGVFALIIYMILVLIVCIRYLKEKDAFYIALFMAFIGYSIQAFANISVIEVAPTFFLIFGLLLSKLSFVKLWHKFKKEE